MSELKPCPICGSKLLFRGKADKAFTPAVIRCINHLFVHGVTCFACGYYKPTIKSWNRRVKNETD